MSTVINVMKRDPFEESKLVTKKFRCGVCGGDRLMKVEQHGSEILMIEDLVDGEKAAVLSESPAPVAVGTVSFMCSECKNSIPATTLKEVVNYIIGTGTDIKTEPGDKEA